MLRHMPPSSQPRDAKSQLPARSALRRRGRVRSASDGPDRRGGAAPAARPAPGVPWRFWGPYLSERQWGTVREDYSDNGDAWSYFSHDQARSRAYRWGEDGLAGISATSTSGCASRWRCGTSRTRSSRSACSGSPTARATTARTSRSTTSSSTTCRRTATSAGCTSTRSAAYPYADLVDDEPRPVALRDGVRAARHRHLRRRPLLRRRGHLRQGRAARPAVPHRRCTTAGPRTRRSTSCRRCGSATRGRSRRTPPEPTHRRRSTAGRSSAPSTTSSARGTSTPPTTPTLLFCDNESNAARLWGAADSPPYPKDGIADHVVHGTPTVNPDGSGTKVAAHLRLVVPAGGSAGTWLRLTATARTRWPTRSPTPPTWSPPGAPTPTSSTPRSRPPAVDDDAAAVMRQALAGMLWSKQSYYFDVDVWLQEHRRAPAAQPAAPRHAQRGVVPHGQPRRHLDARHVGVPVVRGVGPRLPLPPAGDGRPRLRRVAARPDAVAGVPPPDRPDPRLRVELRRRQPAGARLRHAVHAQRRRAHGRGRPAVPAAVVHPPAAQLHVVGQPQGPGRQERVRGRLPRPRQHRRVRPQRGAARRAAASSRPTAPAWMALFSQNMLELALALVEDDPDYADFVFKFVEHFFWIAAAVDPIGDHPDEMWDDEDGFFYDVLRRPDGTGERLKVRSLVGLLPLCATTVISAERVRALPGAGRAAIAPLPRPQPRPARQHRRPVRARRQRAPAAVARQRGQAAPDPRPACSTRSASSGRTASGRSRVSTSTSPTSSSSTASRTACSTSRPSRRRACSAATRTGAARCGSRSTC